MTLTILLCLWRIGEHLTGRAKPKKDDVTIVILGTTESIISAMESIQYTSNTVVCSEPVNNDDNCKIN